MENKREIINIERRDEFAIIWMDDPARSVNTIGAAFVDQLSDAVSTLSKRDLRGVAIVSRKPDFCLGADLEMLREPVEPAAAEQNARRLQGVLDALAALEVPTVAGLAGKCLGGGLELALACDARIADRSCRLGASEIKLGLCPGAGATQRLPRLVGLEDALQLMLTGRSIDCARALDMGLVDACVDEPMSMRVVLDFLEDRHRESDVAGEDTSLGERVRAALLDGNPIGRRLVLQQAEERAMSKTHGNMPAVQRIIEVVRAGLSDGLAAGLEAEARAFGELQATPEARELIRLYFMGRDLDSESPLDLDVRPDAVDRIGILGAGLMGTGIAYVSADGGIRVRLTDEDPRALMRANDHVSKLSKRAVRKGKMTPFEGRKLSARVAPTTGDDGLSRCALVIEAVYEDLELKRELLREAFERGPEKLIFASNTSAIPISKIAEGCARPERVVGMHYFSPVEKMPLLEVIQTESSDPQAVATCVEIGRQQGKKVIVVNDGVGFYTTRVLAAYMAGAFGLLAKGARIDDVDDALEAWGFPMGPFSLADRVGVSLAVEIAGTLAQLGERFELPEAFATADETPSFYQEDARGRDRPNPRVYELLGRPNSVSMDAEDIAWRCVLPMIDEAFRCLEDGVLRSERDGDAGAVFGLGYPPFRGGPFRTVEHLGARKIVSRMREYGFASCERLRTRAG